RLRAGFPRNPLRAMVCVLAKLERTRADAPGPPEVHRVRPRVSPTEDIRTPDVKPGVAVVTDSTTYLPREIVDRWGICEVSLYVGWDGDLRPEGEYGLDAFYTRLRESPTLPATSAPSGGRFPALH